MPPDEIKTDSELLDELTGLKGELRLCAIREGALCGIIAKGTEDRLASEKRHTAALDAMIGLLKGKL